ncbi:PTS lactose transporter subunit IIB [Dactylosporangium sp. CA-092794]|uniref:PTS lactose transporter subunit IIB n=1 Tax=Dactylosporangium sp. CA-092794 TaxID=3239929 RepID=UPI003D8BD273
MPSINGTDIKKVVVACDAGMGSSVMLASQLKRQLAKNSVTVEHTPVNSIPADADVVLCHAGLAARARVSAPDKVIVPFKVFIGDPAVTKVVQAVQRGGEISG